ncbi:MAG: hypothetical protein AB7P04_15905 [Bacteriovoracia bacterium]
MRLVAWGIVIAVSAGGCATVTLSVPNQDMARFAYATGCYQSAQVTCGKLSGDEARGDCYDEALRNCESRGDRFGQWIKRQPGLPATPAEVPAPSLK